MSRKVSTSRSKTNTAPKAKSAASNDPFARKIEQAVQGFKPPKEKSAATESRLNKYIANAGICSRRKADEYIKNGYVTVNDQTVYEMGYKVLPKDVVKFKGKKVISEKKIYVLLNKPRGFITTTSDEKDRKTVMELVKDASDKLRIYPVGRLDRNTSGLLLLTNDGELTLQLSHPSSEVTKVYQLELDKPLTEEDRQKIKKGLQLEDGLALVDEIEYTLPRGNDCHVGIELHIGKNRIVRRIFEHLGYEVLKLDRVLYAGLTKKNLPRGKWRFLTEKELIFLKYFISKRKKPGSGTA